MSNLPTNKPSHPSNQFYQTPIKNKANSLFQSQTADDTNHKSYQSTGTNQPNTINMNIFKHKRYMKRIKKSNFHLLSLQQAKLQEMKAKCDPNLDSVNQKYKQQLDKIYVVVGRVQKIKDEKKYYAFYCEEEGRKEFRMYFAKHLVNNSKENICKPPQHQYIRKITNIDELQFESILKMGVPYFKFFVIFREIPIFQKTEQHIYNSQLDNNDMADHMVDSTRKRFLPKVIGTEFRVYIEHFEKIYDYNYLTWHNVAVCYQQVTEAVVNARKLQVE